MCCARYSIRSFVGMRFLFLFWILLFHCLCDSRICAQFFSLKIADSTLKDTIERSFSTRSDAQEAAFDYYREMLDAGYLLVTADTLISDSTIQLTVCRNEKFLLNQLSIQTRGSGLRAIHSSDVLSNQSLKGAFTKAIQGYENSGYPFASIAIDSLHRLPSRRRNDIRVGVFATLNTGPIVLNDSLHIRSNQTLPYRYVRNYVDFKKGRLYNEFRTQQTERRLREIPFIQVKRPPEIRFKEGKADLYLFIDRKKANYFNGVAGLRPDEATGKVNLTGDAEVRLLNAFNRGEELGLIWRKMQPLTQDLSVKLMLPYLLNSPVALDGKVQIYKRDTSFISVKLLAGAGVLLPRNQRVRVFLERNRSNQLTQFYSGGTIANAEHTLYGLSAQFEMLDYRWNPRQGYSFYFEAATGYRVTTSGLDVAINERRRTLNRGEFQLEYFIPVLKRQTILLSAKGGAILSDSLFENEVLRIGGLRTIRGINEESVFATSWGVASLEYRWLLEENSAVYLFVDQAWYEYKRSGGLIRDVPINAGVGFNFETKAGIFTFNYALGKQFDNPVLVRNGKISFGFRSLF